MDRYEERFNQPMTEIAAGTFTAVLMLAEAIDNAGSTDPQRVRAALLNLDIPGRETIMPWSGSASTAPIRTWPPTAWSSSGWGTRSGSSSPASSTSTRR